jgi:hypothetical protein
MPPSQSLNPAPIALLIGWGSILGIHLCYLLAATWEQVPWCVPYWDSCTSISATGRHPPAFFVFKAIMLPIAGLLLVYWPLVVYWLNRLDASLGGRVNHTIWIMGCIAGLALILYTTMLGAVGDLFQLQRRIGIILFFGLTSFGHLLVVSQLSKLPAVKRPQGYRLQLSLSAILLLGGLLNAVLSLSMENFDAIEDAIEWCFALVMMSQFLVTGMLWRKTGFELNWQQ